MRTVATLVIAFATLTTVPSARASASDDAAKSVPVFTDGRNAPTRRVFTYQSESGVPVFTDRRPANVRYEVMEFSCFACDPASRVNWRATSLYRNQYNAEIQDASTRFGVDAALIRAVVHAESGFNPNARSRKGAVGLMQLMPGTARELGVPDIYAARDNIIGGARYLKQMLERFGGDITLALAAYNAGPNAVGRHGGVPPIAETRAYVERVKILLARYRNAS